MPAAAASAAMACTMCSICAVTLAGSWLRASPATAQRSATTLGAVPPRRMPMFAVVSSSSFPDASRRQHAQPPPRRSGPARAPCRRAPRCHGTRPRCVSAWGGDDQRPRRTVAVEHEHAPRLERAEVERLGAEESGLLTGSEYQFDVARRWLCDEAPGQHEQSGDRRLVVRAQDRCAVGVYEAVGDDHLRLALYRDRVENERRDRAAEPRRGRGCGR